MNQAIIDQKADLIEQLDYIKTNIEGNTYLIHRLERGMSLTKQRYARLIDTHALRIVTDEHNLTDAIRHANTVTGFWDSPIGKLVARGIVRDMPTLSLTEYAEREGITLSAASHRVRRGAAVAVPDPDEPNPRKATRVIE
jgi:hypothetical protein